ncbi:MAG: hypothetical protein BRD35_03485 [Bacteroidetes bacterium QH_7_62_13]|nr:MAG: hypothetical protein BRD35_03485 [Bacteroidetes bacterium QH_7_62_13]
MTPRQQSILIGAVVTGVLSTSYFNFINTLCCLGVIIGGVVAVQQFSSRTGAAVEAGDGAVLGALAGAGGAVIGSVLDRMLRPIGLDSQSISQGMMEGMMKGMEGQQDMAQMMEQMQQDGGGGAMMFLFGLALNVVLYGIFGAIGGAIGSSLFGPEESGGGGTASTGGTPGSGGRPGRADPQAGSSPEGVSNREGSV